MKNLSLSTRMILVLTLITIMSGAILAGWDLYTKPKVEYHREQALQAAIADVLPPYDHYDVLNTEQGYLYVGKEKDSTASVGLAFMAIGSGFQGEVRIMVGYDPDKRQLTGIKVLEQIETPGLGTKIVTDPSNKNDPLWWSAQFEGVAVEPEIVVIKNAKPVNDYEIQGITGATISSKAVVRIINDRLDVVQDLINQAGGHK
ncbi:MAG: FMN-binding protein [Candidatus Marinimicrobia bacterium]|nr:FMN-binding protein [Candidatus Neomarinimicrobiota bacterium]MCF7903805.1 FMN-binding protein [Candidatus Neomarinimicrobiota bacterium]